MNYQIRKAQEADLPAVTALYTRARNFMAQHGNPNQWGTVYPPEEILRQDIARESLYVIQDEKGVHGVFYFNIEEDPTYGVISEGEWHWVSPYGVIHRIAGDGSGGILKTAVGYARKQIGHLRIDTHRDNYVMQRALEKQGFRRCGIIHIEDGSPRIAYDTNHIVRETEKGDLAQLRGKTGILLRMCGDPESNP